MAGSSRSIHLGLALAVTSLLPLAVAFAPRWQGQPPCRIGPGARCAGADLSGRDLARANLRRADLRGARLVGTDLEEADLRQADLHGATLIGVDLARARLQGSRLGEALLLSCDLESADLGGADLRGARLDGNDLESARLSWSLLRGAQLRGVDLESADLSGSDARGADFSGANLGRARLVAGRFEAALLEGANLASARLERARLAGADLRHAHLGRRRIGATPPDGSRPAIGVGQAGGADRSSAQGPGASEPAAVGAEPDADDGGVGALLVDTDFTGADLRWSDLTGVVMLRGSLRQARLEGARTQGSRWLDVAFGATRCPDGVRRSVACSGFLVPSAGVERSRAEARVAWLRSRSWPED